MGGGDLQFAKVAIIIHFAKGCKICVTCSGVEEDGLVGRLPQDSACLFRQVAYDGQPYRVHVGLKVTSGAESEPAVWIKYHKIIGLVVFIAGAGEAPPKSLRGQLAQADEVVLKFWFEPDVL